MSERALWAAVVLQAAADIGEPYGSIEYDEAVAFFTSAGQWAVSRQAISDCLSIHTDDLSRLGRAAIAARHLRDGVPDRVAAVVPRVAAISAPVPYTPPVSRPAPPDHVRPASARKDRHWWIEHFMAKQAAA